MREYYLDLVLCLDVSGNMRDHLARAKEQMKKFPEMLRSRHVFSSHPCRMRIRLIAFSDYLTAGEQAVRLTDFYEYPEEEDELWAALDGLTAKGGFGNRKSGLEAVAYGIRSKWAAKGVNVKIVALWTNGTAREMGLSVPCYPRKMAGSLEELKKWRDEQSDILLVLFAPGEGVWHTIVESWNNVLLFPSIAGEGLDDATEQDIADCIACGYDS